MECTGELAHFNGVRPEIGAVIVLCDQIVYLEVGAFLPGEDGLVCKIGYEEDILALLEGEGGRLSEDGEDNLHLPLLAHPQDIPVLRHAVHLLLDYDGTCQLVAVTTDGPTLLQVLSVHTHSKL